MSVTRTIPSAPEAGSPAALEAELVAARRELAADVEELASRLAPKRLASVARDSARSAADGLRGKADSAVAEAKGRAGLTPDDPRVAPAPEPSGVADDDFAHEAGPRLGDRLAEAPAIARDRLTRLLDDARDGDPASLAVVSGAAVALAAVSALALIKAVRR